MIDKVIILSNKINSVSEGAENLYYRIYVNTDDFGRFHADPKILKGQIYTLRNISISTIEKRLNELIKVRGGDKKKDVGLIEVYESGGELYLKIVDFEEHQTFRKDYVRKHEFPVSGTKSNEIVRTRHTNINKINIKKDKLKTYVQSELEELFEKWWKRYPRTEDEGKAKSKYFNLIENEGVDPQQLEDGLTGYINVLNNNETPKQYVKHAKSFLYNGNKAKNIPSTWESYIKYADPKYRAKPPL